MIWLDGAARRRALRRCLDWTVAHWAARSRVYPTSCLTIISFRTCFTVITARSTCFTAHIYVRLSLTVGTSSYILRITVTILCFTVASFLPVSTVTYDLSVTVTSKTLECRSAASG
jgi:hypothetical protein